MKEITNKHPNLKGLLLLFLIVFIVIVVAVIFLMNRDGEITQPQSDANQEQQAEQQKIEAQLKELKTLQEEAARENGLPVQPTQEDVQKQLEDLDAIKQKQAPEGQPILTQEEMEAQLRELEAMQNAR